MIRKHPVCIPVLFFLLAEAILYWFVLTAHGTTLVVTSYLAIVLCFFFALIFGRKTSPFVTAALGFTVCADFCLVICIPIQQLWGMVFFLGAQICYAITLRKYSNTPLLLLRLALSGIAAAIAVLVLKERTDPLAVVSVCYYANLLMNIVESLIQFRRNKILPIAFVLFILCDTVIGLQVAAGGYLNIPQTSLLYRLLFMNFNLSWFFYLPSQVLLALSTLPTKQAREDDQKSP